MNAQIENLLAETDALLASIAAKTEKLNLSAVGSVEAECDMTDEALNPTATEIADELNF